MKPMQKLTLSINPLIIIVALIFVILAMLALWRPWEGSKVERTITAAGQGEVESTPDEFVFSPYFQRTGSDNAKLKTELDADGNKLMTDLTKLGVKKENITLNSSDYGRSVEPASPGGKPTNQQESNLILSATIKTSSLDLAQKVQDYLSTADAKGQLTPNPNFSKQKRTQLESQARDKATQDARTKADQTAKNLGASVGRVISVKESAASGPIYPLAVGTAEDKATTNSSLPITPGKSTVSSNIEVVFELR